MSVATAMVDEFLNVGVGETNHAAADADSDGRQESLGDERIDALPTYSQCVGDLFDVQKFVFVWHGPGFFRFSSSFQSSERCSDNRNGAWIWLRQGDFAPSRSFITLVASGIIRLARQ